MIRTILFIIAFIALITWVDNHLGESISPTDVRKLHP